MVRKTFSRSGAYAPDTIRAYRADFNRLMAFAEARGEHPFPASSQTIAAFIDLLMAEGKRSASIRRAVTGISSMHNLCGYSDPTKSVEVKLAMRRMHRLIGRHSHQALGINKAILERMLQAIGNSLRDTRDRALLLVAYETMCRRSELVSMRAEDIKMLSAEANPGAESIAILLRRSKTDQEAHGKWVRLAHDGSTALKIWLDQSGITEGPIFRGVRPGDHLTQQLVPGQISRIFKRIAQAANLDKNLIPHISGHSTRVGAAQDLVLAGASLPIIMYRGRWSKSDTVMRYVENLGTPL